MSTRYQFKSVCMVELFGDVLAERVTSTSWGDAPATAIIWIRPKQIADGTLMGNFLHSVKLTNLVEGVDWGGETTMETEDLTLYHCCQWEVVEELCECFPHIRISILSQTLIIEAVPISIDRIKVIAYTWVICLDSWFPLRIVRRSLKRTFKQTSRVTVSTE